MLNEWEYESRLRHIWVDAFTTLSVRRIVTAEQRRFGDPRIPKVTADWAVQDMWPAIKKCIAREVANHSGGEMTIDCDLHITDPERIRKALQLAYDAGVESVGLKLARKAQEQDQ